MFHVKQWGKNNMLNKIFESIQKTIQIQNDVFKMKMCDIETMYKNNVQILNNFQLNLESLHTKHIITDYEYYIYNNKCLEISENIIAMVQ